MSSGVKYRKDKPFPKIHRWRGPYPASRKPDNRFWKDERGSGWQDFKKERTKKQRQYNRSLEKLYIEDE